MSNELRCTDEFLEILKKSLVFGMAVDDIIEDSEKERLLDIYNEYALVPLSREELDEDLQNGVDWAEDFYALVREYSIAFNRIEKETLLTSSIHMIIADGKIDDAEKEYFSQMASSLDFPDADLKEMLSEVLMGPAMDCPNCYGKIRPVQTKDYGKVEKCGACRGFWVPSKELDKFFPKKEAIQKLTAKTLELEKPAATTCPVCKTQTMKVGRYPESTINVDRCSKCKGVFFDKGELFKLMKFAAQ